MRHKAMKCVLEKLFVKSWQSTQLIRITQDVRRVAEASGLKNGFVNVFTLHTTTGITINEDDPKLEEDIARYMVKAVPEDDSYAHHRFFRKDGRMAVNAYSHIRASLLGANVTIPLQDGSLVLGSRQNIYLVELDGPQLRGFTIQILGE
jgi:secondary thiamine-phosphate synthase enzyme